MCLNKAPGAGLMHTLVLALVLPLGCVLSLFVCVLVCRCCMQIIIAFDTRFWPAQLYDVVCTHSFVPELWMTQHTVIDDSSKHLHAVVGEHTRPCRYVPAVMLHPGPPHAPPCTRLLVVLSAMVLISV